MNPDWTAKDNENEIVLIRFYNISEGSEEDNMCFTTYSFENKGYIWE